LKVISIFAQIIYKEMNIKNTILKSLIALLCCAPLVSCGGVSHIKSNESADNGYDIYLLIGQSNMAGRGTMIEGDQNVFSDKVFLLDSEGKAVPATNPLNQYSTIRKDMKMQQIGPGFSFSKKIAEKTGRKILLVVNAKGGTKIEEWAVGTTFYNDAVSRTKEAIALGGQLKGVLWHQGCANSGKPDNYLSDLKVIVESLRKDLNAPKLPFIAGELAYWRKSSPKFNKIIRTISDVIPHTDYVSAEGCSMLKDETDPHFSREGQILLGERYAEKVMKMCY
jgi:hypothetical protein